MIFLPIVVVLLLVLLNGLFSMSEMALVSSRRARLQGQAEKGDKGAAKALALSEDPTRFFSAVQVGITLIGILAGAYGQASLSGALAAPLATIPGLAPYAHAIATALVVVIITYLSLIVGELVPKRLAQIFPEAIASRVSGPLAFVASALSPFVALLTHSTAAVLRLMGVRDRDGSAVTHEEVRTVLAEGASAGVIEPQEEVMIHEVMRLGDRPVRVAMTPRPDVYWVSLTDPEDQLRAEVRACPYSRIVVTREADIDNPQGVVHKKDLLDAFLDTGRLDLEPLVQTPLFIPETASLLRAMELFKGSRLHIAFVVDEFGAFQGVVTTADILEMIAGDFPEEHDTAEPVLRPREDGSYLVDASVDLVDLGQALGEKFETDAGYHTLAGLILHQVARIPEEGEVVRVDGYEVEIVDMDERRIDKVILRRAREPGAG
ncbi:hemolysin family protein [Caulobacter sp. 17J80-11]|uniref:hemolysin family protein n=1 Tax=Caulobacter sp. 17J80-11 TaxID=2763502 RepID=UPI0016534971|nr:hemolysin family protein [Caulobacter sp. 17J80-11]MBC6981099.1 HlyC/CorC family transporter [Caulobacter sp. 17J80-11]